MAEPVASAVWPSKSKSIGAYVATTASADDRAYVQELGADEVIDYQKEPFEEKLKNFDAVFDTVGGNTAEKSFKVLRKGGTLVSMLGQPNPHLRNSTGSRLLDNRHMSLPTS